MTGPLHGIRLVELAGIGPGPFAAMMLADMGAEIVRVDRTTSGDGHRGMASVDILNRGRRSIAVDLKKPAAVEAVLRLVEQADGLLEGFRPGVTERLGLGPDACLARNPRLVYGRMTGWGQDGPYAPAAGHDINYIALTGALHAIGQAGGPPVPPLNLVGDFGGGGMLLAFGMVCGLLEARGSGQGQVVDAAMVDGAALLMSMTYSLRAAGMWDGERGTNLLDGGAPYYSVYETADGKWVALGANEPQFFAELLRRLGLPAELADGREDPANWPVLREQLAGAIRSRTRDAWEQELGGTDVCFGPVLSMAEAAGHPHLSARSTFVERDGLTQPAPAPRFSRTAPELD
ncbi:MAG TPA: CaiB/BaiF CoA-transferase family protein, partial [Mycobacteriales bacterium]|nr:CaiB/BaiF CoA-transferase family protein [Mycobacteriales bacterium]